MTRRAPFLVLFACFAFGQAFAQSEETPVRAPFLGGHRFVAINAVPDPFVRTLYRNGLGVGQAIDIDYGPITIDGQPVDGLEGDLLFALLDFEYQHAIKDWIAARFQVNVTGRLGTDVGSLLGSGVSAATGYEFGWLVRVFEKKSTLLSLGIELSNRDFTTISIKRFVEGVVDSTKDGRLVETTPSVRSGGELRFAWGLSEAFGLTLLGGAGYGESVEKVNESELFTHAAGTLSFDLNAVTSLPLGLAAGVIWDSFPEASADVTGGLVGTVFSIAYTGRPDLQISIENTLDTLELEELNDVKFASTVLNIRYYF